jgi:hypothetical protein
LGKGCQYLLASAVVALVATSAAATPVAYLFDSGDAHISMTRTGDNSLVAEFDLDLTGTFLEFDTTGGTLEDLEITVGTSAPITLLQVWGGFDTFVIESASITPGIGYSSIFSSMTGPSSYAFLVGPLDIAGVYSASLSTGPPPSPVTNIPLPFTTRPFLNGTIDTDLVTLELLGLTLSELDGASFGETDDLVVKADLTWVGEVSVPEPSTGALVLAGLGWLASRRRPAR